MIIYSASLVCFLVTNYIIIVPARAARVQRLVAFSLHKSFSSPRVSNFTHLKYVFVIHLLIEYAYWRGAETNIPDIYYLDLLPVEHFFD